MPREVNYLTHSSAGILSKKFVNQVNQNIQKDMGIAVQFLQIQMEKMRFCKWRIHYDTEKCISSNVST